MRLGYAKDSIANVGAFCGSIAKLFPVLEPATGDYVVDGGQGLIRVIQVTVQHAM